MASFRTAALIAPVLLLAACGKGGDGDGTDISLQDKDGNVVASADDKSGAVSVNVPGFSARLNLPKMEMNADDLDIDGVKLYPGSKVSGMNIHDGGEGKDDVVDIRFSAPAAPDKVQAYFLKAFSDKGEPLTAAGSGLAGKGKDGGDVRIDLKPAADGATAGVITLASKDDKGSR